MDGGRRGRHLGVALLTVAVLGMSGLTACTDDDTTPSPPTTTPHVGESSTSASPSASPTARPPTAPKAEPTPKSAEAFVKYFWDVHNYAYATLDLKTFKSISEPGCTFCSSTITDLESLKESGSVAEGSSVRLWVAAVPPGKIGKRTLVSTVISQEAGREIDADGSTKSFPGMLKTNSAVALSWTDQHWLIHDISIDKPGQR